MDSERLNKAVRLIKSGDKQAAIPILKEIIQANPRDENAWLWLSACVDNLEQKKLCLQKALEINPGNPQAQNALRDLKDKPPQPVQQVAPLKETPSTLITEDSNRGKRNLLFAIGGSGALLLLCVGALLYLMRTGGLSMLAAGLPTTPIPSPVLSPTATRTLIPTPTYTATATVRPSPTLSLTPIPLTPSPTIPPFTPGNPTATPLGSNITDSNYINGRAAFYAGHYQEAITQLSLVIETSPDLAPPYRYRGLAYASLNDCATGLADMEKALSIDPNYAAAWGSRGYLKGCLGDADSALPDFQKALSLDPSLAFVYSDLGAYYFVKGAYQKSLEEYTMSVSIDPTRSAAWGGRSEALTKLGQYQECVISATRSVTLDPKHWSSFADRAFCELKLANYDASIADYKMAAAHDDDNSNELYNMGVDYGHRGDVYYKLKKYDLAIADYKMAVKLIPGDAHSYCQLSYSDFEIGDYRGTVEAGKLSIVINPSCGGQKLLDEMGRSSYFLGDYDQAIDYLDQALAKGEYPLGYYYRGISYQAVGKKQEAIDDLKQFLAYSATGKEADDARARLAKLEH